VPEAAEHKTILIDAAYQDPSHGFQPARKKGARAA